MASFRECVLIIKKYYSHLLQAMLHPLIVANQHYEKNIIDINIKAKFVGHDPSKDAYFQLRAIFRSCKMNRISFSHTLRLDVCMTDITEKTSRYRDVLWLPSENVSLSKSIILIYSGLCYIH